MAAGFSKIVSKNKQVTDYLGVVAKDSKFLDKEKVQLLQYVDDLVKEIQGVPPDDYVDPNPEPPPTTPSNAVARLYKEGTGLTLEVVFTAPGNTGTIPTTFQVEREDNISDNIVKWNVVGTVSEGSTYLEHYPVQQDVPYAYRVRGVKVIKGVTCYSAYSNIADPEPFVPDVNDGDRKVIQPGSLDRKSGKFQGVVGKYTLTDPESNLDFKGVEGTVIEIASGAMLTHRGATDVILDTLTIDGKGSAGGEKGPDNAKAMVQPGDGWKLRNLTIKGGRGVLVGCDGMNIRANNVKCLNGGSSGFGGKCDRGILVNVLCDGCNVANNSTDGAAFGKFTRTGGLLVIDSSATNGKNATIWGDINNSNWVLINFLSKNIDYSNSSKKWTGAGVKLEISANKSEALSDILDICKEAGVITANESTSSVTEQELRTYNFVLVNCSSVNTKSYCFDFNETKDVMCRDCSGTTPISDSDGGHGSTRDLVRSDAGSKNPPRDKDWRCNNVTFKNFKVLDSDTFVFMGSGAGNTIDGNKNKISIINPLGKDGTPAKLKVVRATNIKIST